MATFIIKFTDGEIRDAEPVVGRWYCAVTEYATGDVSMGCIGEYLGHGEFFDEDRDVTDAMHEADYLQEQA